MAGHALDPRGAQLARARPVAEAQPAVLAATPDVHSCSHMASTVRISSMQLPNTRHRPCWFAGMMRETRCAAAEACDACIPLSRGLTVAECSIVTAPPSAVRASECHPPALTSAMARFSRPTTFTGDVAYDVLPSPSCP